jgi:ribulose-5-phosphate 4-epimerase/fuculose-1-phosphate aldolase
MSVTAVNRNTEVDARAQTKIDLAAALRWAVRMGFHEGICNHFSAVIPGEDDRFLINPHGYHWSEVRASDLVEVDADGKAVNGKEPPEPTAFFIHYHIHRNVPEAKVVLHTHMPYATALTILEDGRLEPTLQTSLKFYNDIAYDDDYNGLALDDSEGERIAKALQGGKKVAFLANHGIVVVGETVADAYDNLYYLERACQAQVIAMSTGRPMRRISQDVAQMTHDQMSQPSERAQAVRHFEALKRLLEKDEADYKD